MAATHGLLRPPANPSLLSSPGRRPVQLHRQVRLFHQGRRRPQVRVFAAMGDEGSGGGRPEGDSAPGGSIDEDMPTLWKRIGELEEEQQQQRCEGPGKVDALLPVELISRLQREDEYVLYRSGMLEVMGLLHLRPAAAAPERVRVNIGVTVTAKLVLPTSVLVVMLHLMDAATVILHGVQQKQ